MAASDGCHPVDAELIARSAALELRGASDAAERRYRRAAEADPENADTRYHLGNLSRLRPPDEAMAVSRRPVAAGSRFRAGNLISVIRAGRTSCGLAELELAVNLNP